jgi:hypothetical protein
MADARRIQRRTAAYADVNSRHLPGLKQPGYTRAQSSEYPNECKL